VVPAPVVECGARVQRREGERGGGGGTGGVPGRVQAEPAVAGP